MAADTLSRLRALAREAGCAGPASTAATDDTMNRLRALQRVGGRQQDAVTPTPAGQGGLASEVALARRLGGERVEDGLIRVRSTHPLPPDWSERDLGLPGQSVTAPGLVFLDTETTGLAGGSGTLAFLVGTVRIRGGALHLAQYLITRYDAEAPMLRALRAESVQDAQAWVTYNGKSYDLPLLETRSRLQGQGAWVALPDHLDLVHGVRRGFADRWPDCRLVTAERRLLGLIRHDDLPGAEAPEAWFRYLRHGDSARLVRVVDHNRQDLLSLVALLPVVSRLHHEPHRFAANPLGIARHVYSAGNDPDRAMAILKQGREVLDAEGVLELARWARRHEDEALAVSLWEELAARGHQGALEALSKYLEHVRRDYGRALELARQLRPAHHHRPRVERLQAKLARVPGTR
jgi:uncharacterized protein YprB with RNaseH-like and TPR domain